MAAPPRSLPKVVMATRHPLLSPPMTLNNGARAWSMNVSANPLPPVICLIGRNSIPLGDPSSSRMGTSRPSRPSVTRSSAPVFAVATTGRPQASACASTRARPSSMDGRTSTEACE